MLILFLQAFETVFATKAVARQLALAVALETGMVTVNQVLRVAALILSNFSSRSRLIRHLKRQQNNATCQDEWMVGFSKFVVHATIADEAWTNSENFFLNNFPTPYYRT